MPRIALSVALVIAFVLPGCDTGQRSEVERLQAEICAGRRLSATANERRLAYACEARAKDDGQMLCRATPVYTAAPAAEGTADACAAERVYSHCKLHCEPIPPTAAPTADG